MYLKYKNVCVQRSSLFHFFFFLFLFLINRHAKLEFGVYGYQYTSRDLDWFLLIHCYLVNAIIAVHRWGK